MQVMDPEAEARARRVQDICAQLTHLVSLSWHQRQAIDRLLGELEAVAQQARAGEGAKVRTAGATRTNK